MKFFKKLFISDLFFTGGSIITFLCVLGYFSEPVFAIARVMLFVFVFLFVLDYTLLFFSRGDLTASRLMSERLSNGDENEILLRFSSSYAFSLRLLVIDELPFRFQYRNFNIRCSLRPGGCSDLSYSLRPVERGEYHFGSLLAYSRSPIGLVVRRWDFEKDFTARVYPSIIQMKKYDFFAVSDRLVEVGVKKIRPVGQSMEFDRIRKYVSGDDYRKINWKATARRQKLMVNQFRDERSQHVYSIVDMGRAMKMPFNGMSLLDYAVNSTLVLSNVAIRKDDRAGLITFSKDIESIVPAERNYSHLFRILETLYNAKTDFLEANYELLAKIVSTKLRQRSLVLLYTNFESLSSLKRNIRFLRMISEKHYLVVIFFENTGIRDLLDSKAVSVEDVYIKTAAEKFVFEKRQIVRELEMYGIKSILTTPENLTISTINKYLELKARGII